ncbi:NTT1 [Hepatospora eriocheir]|uniref:ADP,ATP carrier protein n=1 Tax=Hepatospora eriocheir TaxID=1081669 RepID=A0A1X0QA91_9MICR|nr:NTT1 [Hepatospora eriocheir]
MFSGRTAFYTLENYGGMLVMAGIKIFKYTSFDVTKEKISMRIEERYRPKFKSIYDGIFNKVGKSGGSVYSIMANAVFKDISPRGIAPITLLFSSGFIFVWIILLFYLGANYNKSISNQKPIEIDLFNEEDEEESEKEEGEIKEGERINERPKETEKVKKIVL